MKRAAATEGPCNDDGGEIIGVLFGPSELQTDLVPVFGRKPLHDRRCLRYPGPAQSATLQENGVPQRPGAARSTNAPGRVATGPAARVSLTITFTHGTGCLELVRRFGLDDAWSFDCVAATFGLLAPARLRVRVGSCVLTEELAGRRLRTIVIVVLVVLMPRPSQRNRHATHRPDRRGSADGLLGL
jgi:hypothetical protein